VARLLAPPRALARAALTGAAALAAAVAAGCGQDCCTVDSEPIPVTRAPLGQVAGPGAVLAHARPPGGDPASAYQMVVDTGSPVTIIGGPPQTGTLQIEQGGFDLLDGTQPLDAPQPHVRARFRNLGVFTLPLGTVGDTATPVGGVIGGDLLHAFSVELRFGPCTTASAADAGALDAGALDAGALDAGAASGAVGPCPALTFWRHQGASQSFLEDAGYAVLQFHLFGGGETTAQSPPDFLGLRGPVELPATRIVLRGCAAPRTFTPMEQREACCQRGDEITNATGVDLALLLATGTGPMVLSHSAWMRTLAKGVFTATPAMTRGPLLIATWPTPIDAQWTTLPRFALVDGSEPPSTGDEGPCVDLARARRIEWTVRQASDQVPFAAHAAVSACPQPCDTDPSSPSESLNSAAYVELGGDIPVAVVDDAEPFLQSLRFDIRPEGPDIDGLVGAGALAAARLEIDYLSDTPRAIFSCELNTPRDACFAAARCPRLPSQDYQHLCFGQPLQGLPLSCAPSGC
jgi:hypothetical protein